MYVRGFPGSSAGKESACNVGDTSSIPGSGRSAGEGIGYPFKYSWASLEAQMIKNLPAMQETWVRSLGWEDPLEKERQPTPVFLPGEFHEQRSLANYSPCNDKKLTPPSPLTYLLHFIYVDPRLTYYCLFHLYVRRVTEQLSQHLLFGLMESGCTLLESISTLYFHSSIYCSLRPYYLGLEKNKFQLAL